MEFLSTLLDLLEQENQYWFKSILDHCHMIASLQYLSVSVLKHQLTKLKKLLMESLRKEVEELWVHPSERNV